MLATTLLIRMLPMALLRKPIENRFIKSFLYYVPYVTLTVMTFPAILSVTHSPLIGALALAAGVILALTGVGMFPVAIICSVIVFILQFIIK